jgi:hypothetical protein
VKSKYKKFRVPKDGWERVCKIFDNEPPDTIVCKIINHIYYSYSFGHEELLHKLPKEIECQNVSVKLPSTVLQKLKNASLLGFKANDVLYSGIMFLLEE